MEWSDFRNGTPLALPSGREVGYRELVDAGFAPFYVRVAFTMLRRGAADAERVDAWLAAGDDPKRMEAAKTELRRYHERNLRPPATEPAGDDRAGKGAAKGRGASGKGGKGGKSKGARSRERRYPMISRTRNLGHARREAAKLGLEPTERRIVDPASGGESVRLEVDATKQQATTLTLSGFWMHRPKADDDARSPSDASPRARARKRRPRPDDSEREG